MPTEANPGSQALPRSALILLMGVAGSGKTAVARGLLARYQAAYLDNNFLADAFFPQTRRGTEYRRIRSRLYRALYRIAEENLRVGNSVLLDAPHIRQSCSRRWLTLMQSMTQDTTAALVMVRCVAPEDVIRRRLEARGEPRDLWKLEHWEDHLRRQPIARPISHAHLDLNTDRAVEESVEEVLRYILSHSPNG